jgi:hypothetical protein
MAQIEVKSNGGWLAGLRGKAAEAIEKQQAAFALGKVAGVTVTDGQGNTIVDAGQRIDEAVVAQAYQCGKVAALGASALHGQKQDIKEKVQAQYARTENGREARLLDSVEEFAEVHQYLGRATTMDVTDIRGNILVPAGKVLDAADAQLARDAGQLGALLVAARESVPAAHHPAASYAHAYTPVPRPQRPRTLLGEPGEDTE